MKENITISQLEEMSNKYGLHIHPWSWCKTFDLKIHNGGLLLARVNFDNDLIVAIRMPDKYGVFYSDVFNRENIGTSGWIDVTTLAQFEKQTKKLIEEFKKCLVKLRKDFLEKDFD